MGLYEIKKKYYDNVVVLYEQQYGILQEYEARLVFETDPNTKAKYNYEIVQIQSKLEAAEANVLKAEADVEKYATRPEKLFNPPPKIYIGGGNGKQDVTPTAPSADVETSFNPEEWGVAVASGELESILSDRAKYVEPVPYMNGLKKSIMGVGRVELNGEAFGTGFLVDKNRLLTNWHVVRDPKYIEQLSVRFGHFFSDEKTLEPGVSFKITKLLAWSDEKTLDYALVEVEGDPTESGQFNVLTPSTNAPNENRVVNILHHPKGVPLKLSTQDNWVKKVKGDRVLYLTGTEPGSSGAPVFNDKWELVALHHSGKPYPPGNFPGTIEANEGIVMKAVLDDLTKQGVKLA